MTNKFKNSINNPIRLNPLMFPEMKNRTYSKGSLIFSENDPISEIHFITSGKVEIRKHSHQGFKTLYHLGKGDLLGIHHAISGNCYANTANATKETKAISFNKKEFMKMMKCNVELRMWILKYLSFKIDSISNLI